MTVTRHPGWVRFVGWVAVVGLAVAATLAPGGAGGRAWAGDDEPVRNPLTGDNPIFRTLVVVRKGPALGSGVIIASVPGESLILTAAHVVADSGPLHIELGRYNYGWEQTHPARGWPRRVGATVAALDRASDLAILRVPHQPRLPFVARVGTSVAAVPTGTGVASLGFDHGGHLTGFPTRVRRVELVDLGKGGGDRPFLVTDHPPEVGRSGGGLFLDSGTLVGICLARVEVDTGRTLGLYSPLGNIRRLLATEPTLEALVADSTPLTTIRPTAKTASPTERSRPVAPR